jgi:hypothetical protein
MKAKRKRKIKIPTLLVEKLISTPESGMGYHKVDLMLKDGNKLFNQTILNCSILLLDEDIELSSDDIVDLKKISN